MTLLSGSDFVPVAERSKPPASRGGASYSSAGVLGFSGLFTNYALRIFYNFIVLYGKRCYICGVGSCDDSIDFNDIVSG